MGFTRKRLGRKGPRYTAYYQDIRGNVLSAGTFSNRDDSDDAWQDAEAKVRAGQGAALTRGKQKFGPYVTKTWFPNHKLELRGRENYSIYLDAYIMDWFRHLPMNQIFGETVREFVTKLTDDGVKPSSIEYCLTILSAIFTTALNDQIVFIHPCKGVKAPTRAKKIRKIITPEQFDLLYRELGDEAWCLLVETDIETGLRWGELTELRPKDFDFSTCTITITRVVVELIKKRDPEGRRFVVKEYPKDEEHREVTFSPQLGEKIQAYIAARGFGPDSLLFSMPRTGKPSVLRAVPDPHALGPVEPGSRYWHGTISAYSGYKCRCEHCRTAYAIYRSERRRLGRDSKKSLNDHPVRIRMVDTDGHIPRRIFRSDVWLPARQAVGLSERVTPHSLRHAHASWLLAGGADIAVVKERLGHSSILTTQKYLHTLPDAEKDVALEAFSAIRNRSKNSNASTRKGGRSA
jgi:integrase